MRIIGIIVATFLIAAIYGFYVTTTDFMRPNYDPVAAGHQAADNVYGSFGLVTSEIKRNDPNSTPHRSVAYKVAMPYAITADLAAIFGGKVEVAVAGLAHYAPKPSVDGTLNSSVKQTQN